EALSITGPTPQAFTINYSPAATPGPTSSNAMPFTVQPNMQVLDVFANIDDALDTGEGDTVGILLTDPNGNTYSSGVMLPVEDAPNREVIVNNPIAGQWFVEVRGVRGLTALPEVSLPTSGAALPGTVSGTITQQQIILGRVADIQGDPSQTEIEY